VRNPKLFSLFEEKILEFERETGWECGEFRGSGVKTHRGQRFEVCNDENCKRDLEREI